MSLAWIFHAKAVDMQTENAMLVLLFLFITTQSSQSRSISQDGAWSQQELHKGADTLTTVFQANAKYNKAMIES